VTPALRATGLVVRYGGVAALDGVDVAVCAGEILGLVGANGAGKTTVLDCLSGHTRPSSGRVWMGDADISRLGPGRRGRRGIVRSFFDARLFPTMAARDVLRLAGRRRRGRPQVDGVDGGGMVGAGVVGGGGDVGGGVVGVGADVGGGDGVVGAGLVGATGLEAYLDERVGQLSTGVRKRLDLACLAALAPRVLLLDEPSAGLAGVEVPPLAGWLRQLRDSTGAAVIMVEHDLPLVWAVADRVLIVEGGRVVAEGPPSELREHPALDFGRFG
jgi:ABC-type branched-subunit amino acid transport system ATPase component